MANKYLSGLINLSILLFTYFTCFGKDTVNLSPKSQYTETNIIINVQNRKVLSLNGRWNYIIDPYENGYYNYRRQPFDQTGDLSGGFYSNQKPKNKSERIEYDFDFSPAMTIPGDWNSQAKELEFYEGTIWVKRSFDIHKQPNKRYFLYFGAVNYEAHVYLNGKKLGVHIGGFTPFNFEITNILKDKDNYLILKVDNTRRIDGVPTVNTDWWNYGGITRDVCLIETNATFIRDYKIQLAKNNMSLIEGYVQLDGKACQQTIHISIPEAGIFNQVKTDIRGFATINIPVSGLKLWSPNNPFLYDVIIKCETDTLSEKIGFRTITTKGDEILLNGKPIFLRGICIHEENPMRKGRAFSEADAKVLLNWAKELNCNYVRLAHYPHNEYMIRCAEEMGILVWEEIPVYWTIQWENKETLKNALNQLTEMITRDKNRANVIIWSVGNETPVTESRLQFMKSLVEHARKLDNTRLISAALEVHTLPGKSNTYVIDDPLGEVLDVVSFNEYIGWYDGTPDKCDSINWKFFYNKPVIISETGAGALQGFYGDNETIWSEDFQVYFYKKQLEMIKNQSQIKGLSPWILVDFRSPRRQHPVYQNFWNRKGLISSSGIKKKAFNILKNFYEEIEKINK